MTTLGESASGGLVARHKVWITLPDGQSHCAGDLAFGRPEMGGRCPSAFRYSAEWLRSGFPLDPESLPLQPGEFHSSHLASPLAVFSDALPDAWGQHIIDVTRGIPLPSRYPERYITEIGGHTMGALGFNEPAEVPDNHPVHSMCDLARAAMDVDAGRDAPSNELARLFAHGASAGGARPKVLVFHEGAHWIVKLPSPHKDRELDVPLLEYVAMQIAGDCLPDTPETRLMSVGGRNAVLIRRFDLTRKGRNHQISFSSLGQERVANYAASYDDLARIVTKHSVSPADDLRRLFTQSVLNAAIGNTDDHLKNFMMQHAGAGYRLSPAFDIVPNIGRNTEHVIAFGISRNAPSRGTLIEMGRRWLGEAGTAAEIIDRVTGIVSTFRSRLTGSAGSHEAILNEIDARCAAMGATPARARPIATAPR